MFLDSGANKGKRRRSSRGRYRFDASVKRRSKKNSDGQVWYRLGAIMLLLLVIGGVSLALYAGFVYARDALFAHNDRFRIEKIEVDGGQIKTDVMIREYLEYEHINVGTNLFGFDIDEFEKLYLKRNPLVKTIQVTRVLPGKLKVAIQERDPLARIGQRGTLVTDSDGFVFRLSSKLHRLPPIIGCKDTKLAPGGYVRGRTLRAVEVMSVCDNPRVGVRVVGVDVSKPDYLVVHVLTAYGIKLALLAWDDMDKGLAYSGDDLLKRLNRLRRGIKQDRGAHNRYDVTYPDSVRAR
jgi:cell division septal protein FtsQ